jgi:hypothetical protein
LVPADVVYLNYLITSVAGVPGSFIACYTVDLPGFGRKGTMAVSTLCTAISLFMFTISGNSAWQTFAACLQSLFSVRFSHIYTLPMLTSIECYVWCHLRLYTRSIPCSSTRHRIWHRIITQQACWPFRASDCCSHGSLGSVWADSSSRQPLPCIFYRDVFTAHRN